MDVFAIDELVRRRRESDTRSLEFFRSSTLSLTVYELPAGATDEQSPHNEDEVYYVVGGRATYRQEDEERPVSAGDVIFVEARVPHRFEEIEEDLTLLVFFAPPKT